jgi:PAS domain-containing protein
VIWLNSLISVVVAALKEEKIAKKAAHKDDYFGSQLRALMESLPIASWFKDAEGNFSQVNEALLSSLGKNASQVI